MNKQDNPHAKGLSINQDVICEDYSEADWQKAIDECRVSIEYGLETESDRAVQQWKRMRCSISPVIDIKRVASFFPSVLKESVSWYYGQLPHFNRVIPIMELDGSGLALTNPEE